MVKNISIKFAGTTAGAVAVAVTTAGAEALAIECGRTVGAGGGGVTMGDGRVSDGQVLGHWSFGFFGMVDFFPEVRLGLETTMMGEEYVSGEI